MRTFIQRKALQAVAPVRASSETATVVTRMCEAATPLLLGEGALSTVHLEGGFAVKVTRKSLVVALKQIDAVLREKEALEAALVGGLASPYIARLHSTAQDGQRLMLRMDAVVTATGRSMNLRQLQSSQPGGRVPPDGVKFLAACLASAVAHLHERFIAHRDIKPENIVLSADGTPVLVDFGCARFVRQERNAEELRSKSLVGTLPHLAPEMLARTGHGRAVDWWSLGVVVYEAVAGVHPFAAQLTGGVGTCSHTELMGAQQASNFAEGVVSLPADLGRTPLTDKKLLLLLSSTFIMEEHERARKASLWASNHHPDSVRDAQHVLVDTLPGALARDLTSGESASGAASSAETEGTPEEALAEKAEAEAEAALIREEREALLERAEAAWKRSAGELQMRFKSFGPWVTSGAGGTSGWPGAPLEAAAPPAVESTARALQSLAIESSEAPADAPPPSVANRGAPPPVDTAAAASCAGVSVSTRSDAHWVALCSAMERKCFAKHEAMDVTKEAKGRGATLLCASPLAQPQECVGYAMTTRSSLALHLTKLVVTPAERRKGVGRALLAKVLDVARSGRAQVCTLHVDEGNTPAQALYRSLGFEETGRRDDYYRVGRHALVMEKEMTDGAVV